MNPESEGEEVGSDLPPTLEPETGLTEGGEDLEEEEEEEADVDEEMLEESEEAVLDSDQNKLEVAVKNDENKATAAEEGLLEETDGDTSKETITEDGNASKVEEASTAVEPEAVAEEEEEEMEGNPSVPEEEDEEEEENEDMTDVQNGGSGGGRKRVASASEEEPKRKVVKTGGVKSAHDVYCWVCHKDGIFYSCKICPRSYHAKCLCLPDFPDPTLPEGDGSKICVCPECLIVMKAENVNSRSDAMKTLSIDELVGMLKFICGRLKSTPGAEPFLKPVNADECTDYYDYIVYPMDVATLEKNIKQRQYGSTEAFLSDAQWITHNSIIYNSNASPYTAAAKRLLKVCRQELVEIETCPECYNNAHTKADTWFIEACRRPHVLVWAKLKGFPFWPAKAMKGKDDQVDVRFFGQHDRAWVALKDCFLYSEEMPVAPPKKNGPLLAALDELRSHVEKLKEAHGRVVFYKVKTPMEGLTSTEHIRKMFPDFQTDASPSKSKAATDSDGEKEKPSSQAGKSPMTITISSIKTNPTIVSNSLGGESTSEVKGSPKKSTSGNTSSNESPTKEGKAEKVVEKTTESPEKPKEKEKETQPVPSGEILANALGLKRVVRKPSTGEKEKGEDEMNKRLKVALLGGKPRTEEPAIRIRPQSELGIKEDDDEEFEEEEGGEGIQIQRGGGGGSRQEIMESLLAAPKASNNPNRIPGMIKLPQGMQITANSSGGARPKVASGSPRQPQSLLKQMKNSPNQMQGVQNNFNKQQRVQITRTLNPMQQMTMNRGRGGTKNPIVVDSTSLRVDNNPNYSQQGITLPGGTITVTPLTNSLISGTSSSMSTSAFGGGNDVSVNGQLIKSNGLPFSSMMGLGGGDMVSSGKGKGGPQRRNVSLNLPASVNTLIQHFNKGMGELMRGTIEQIAYEILESGQSNKSNTEMKLLQQEMEGLKQKHKGEIMDLRHNNEITMRELRNAFEIEKKRLLNEQKRVFEVEKQRAIDETKRKQWCANCRREALFYCCWNVSYCGYVCQEEHWAQHMSSCHQNQSGDQR